MLTTASSGELLSNAQADMSGGHGPTAAKQKRVDEHAAGLACLQEARSQSYQRSKQGWLGTNTYPKGTHHPVFHSIVLCELCGIWDCEACDV